MRARRGMSLIEVMVVIAILIALAAVLVPTISTYFELEQRQVAKELALDYELLHDEAVLRNVTFRVAYHLEEKYWVVEVGSPETLIFDDPQARAAYEEKQEDRFRLLTKDERAQAEQKDKGDFQQLQTQFETKRQLPQGTVFGGVYTPQYGQLVTPSGDAEKPTVVYSYVFPSGFSEHTIVQLVNEDDPTSGYTVEVEPLTGEVTLSGELKGPDSSKSDVPEEGPELPQ